MDARCAGCRGAPGNGRRRPELPVRPGGPNQVRDHILQQACLCQIWVGVCGGGYLNGLKLSGVRDGALGVTPPKSQSRVQSEVRFCTNSSGECRNGRGYDGGCYLSDLKAPGECCGALELCAPLPSEKGSTGKVCTSGCCEAQCSQTLVFPTPAT